ncbi:hypothetical protein [Streptomyces mobaraensis]|uniref:Uncharacterized protein n=1 Tax=Streptomyces mobaraensis TaxID=35621 RepID=A0A5N5W170_STRMB|nr:hypothetical protein [Streptomyces mobaraensis]KAB7835521.1 hypothetical protein FRZ00_26900 [Streptomyces mobaraensis]
MTTTALWPPRTHDGSALIHAYASVLGWPLFVGTHRVSAQTAERELAHRPATTLRTMCAAFDAISVAWERPRWCGSSASTAPCPA